MSAKPWDTDHPLDAARAESLVAASFPDLAPVKAVYVDEGWDSVVFVVNREWVFRFPKRAQAEATHDVECALLPRLADRLPLPVPRPRWRSERSPSYPFRFMGYARIAGTPALSLPLDAADVAACGDQLGEFLTALHSFSVKDARSLGVPDLPPAGRLDRAQAKVRECLDSVRPMLSEPLRSRVVAFLDGPMPKSVPFESRLVHDDLGDAHFLLDSATGRVSGVLDWADASIGDPAVDFGGLWQWLGEPLVDRALRVYRGSAVDDGLWERARACAVLIGLSTLWYGVEARRAEHVLSGVRSLEHSLPT
jgi:aminoglycoside phosphotransferase (APT) family kinase protein